MQAIQTKYLPATNTRGSRIKAWCERGSITVDYPHELSGDAVHRLAVHALVNRFNEADAKEYGPSSVKEGRGWNAPFVTGFLPDGTAAHVFNV